MVRPKVENQLKGALLFCISTLCLYLFWVAITIRVDYSDTYFSLLNGKTIAAGAGIYDPHRFILVSLLQAPFSWLERITGLESFVGAHVFSVMTHFILLYVLFLLLNLVLNPIQSLFGVLLFLLNPMIIHYFPMAKEDLQGTLLTALVFYFYLKYQNTKQRSYLLMCSLSIGLAMALRYNLIPCLVISLFFLELMKRKDGYKFSEVTYYFIVPFIILFLFPVFIYPQIGKGNVLQAPLQFIYEFFKLYGDNSTIGGKPFWVPLAFLINVFNPILLVLFFMSFYHGKPRVFLVWFSVFFLIHVFIVPGKEIRYLFPLFPAVYALALINLFKIKNRNIQRGLVLLLLVFSTVEGLKEYWKFQDPFYRDPFVKKISMESAELAKNKKLIWVGGFFATYPKEFVFHQWDDFAYLYHFYAHEVHYYTGREVFTINGNQMKVEENQVWLPGIGAIVEDGDVLMVNPDQNPSTTRTISKVRPAFYVQQVKLSQKIEIGIFELYDTEVSTRPKSLGLVQIISKEQKIKLPKNYFLLSFNNVRKY